MGSNSFSTLYFRMHSKCALYCTQYHKYMKETCFKPQNGFSSQTQSACHSDGKKNIIPWVVIIMFT